MRERVGKLLIGFVAVAIFMGMAESSTNYAKKQELEKEMITSEQEL